MSDINTLKWSIQKKFLFLFILSYTFFYIFPFPFDAFPQLDFIFKYYQKAYDVCVLWIGENILHIKNLKKSIFSDSGDTLFHFTSFFLFLILSATLAILIILIDKKRNDYEKLQSYLFVYVRYCIGFYMLVYGFDKVFKSHFPFPSLEKLEQTFGDSSPQGLLWAFMGYSTSYNMYLGIIEVLSGFLLLFRRTTALGAILVMLVMINVAFINFSYDVPVKLFALHMIAYAFLLLYPFFNSIFQFFILRKETKLTEQKEIVFPTFIQKYQKAIKAVVIFSFTLLFMNFSWTNMKEDGDNAPKPALYGIYRIDMYMSHNHNITGVVDSDAWREIVFDKKITAIKTYSLGVQHFTSRVDTINKKIVLISNTDLRQRLVFDYTFDSETLKLQGHSAIIVCKKLDINEFPLIKRKFHWVVEYPVNN